MRRIASPLPRRSRVGLALGAGGVLGTAWMIGALAALERRLPCPAGDVDVLVGTSAGSVLAAALRCGVSVRQLADHQRGVPNGLLSTLCAPDLGCAPLPSWPSPRLGSPGLLVRALQSPNRMHPWVLAAACLPQGRAEHGTLRAVLQGLLEHTADGAWPGTGGTRRGGRTWITAVDYDTGRRVAFGRPGAPPASLPDAVVASCSIPGWYRPAVIAGRRYIDGGIWSPASADLLVPEALDEVYVLAPAASLVTARARNLPEWLERHIRAVVTGTLRREAAALRAGGARVTILTPGPEDLAAMGANLMDAGRRLGVFELSLLTSAAALARDRKAAAVPA